MNKILIRGNFKTSIFRHEQNKIIKEQLINLSNIRSVLNIGSNPNDKDKEGGCYKNYFLDKDYYTLDKNYIIADKNHFALDLHDLSSVKLKFDLILLMNVLEHVENPFKVVDQVNNILADNGYLFFSSPFFYPIHKAINLVFSDYWRFTDDGIKILFKMLRPLWIKPIKTVIESVSDREAYWNDLNSTPSGYCCLFQNEVKFE